MIYFICCILVFLAAYTLNMTYVSVFYHRGFAHQAVMLRPWLKTFVASTGNWVTGLDLKGWVCMHRMHHKFSDTELDPHSPVRKGIWNVLFQQLRSYNKTLVGLIHGKRKYTSMVSDIHFDVSWLNRYRVWYLPYLVHAMGALLVGFLFDAWVLGLCYWLGMMSHPVQGWMVNALAHRFGSRNFALADNSRNNHLVAWLVFGEGFQNNHHFKPESANFSHRVWELDLGFAMCRALSAISLLKFR